MAKKKDEAEEPVQVAEPKLSVKTHGDAIRQTPGWQAKRKKYLLTRYGVAGAGLFDKEQAAQFSLEATAAHDGPSPVGGCDGR